MAEIRDYSVTADDNNAASPNGMAENCAPSTVNNTWREGIARMKRWYEDVSGVKVTAGSSNTYTLSASRTVASYQQGDAFLFEANHSNTAAATINVDSLGAKSIVHNDGTALRAGDMTAAGMYLISYEASNDRFILVGGLGSAQNLYINNSSPNIMLENSSNENSDGGRESTIQIKGKQDGNEITTLATIVTSHDGSSDDQKGVMKFNINDGDDGDSPSKLVLKLDSAALTTLGGNLVIPNAGNIGSVSDTDALAISSAGVVTATQMPITPNPTFRAYRTSSDQSMSHNTATLVELNAEAWDIGSYYDTSTFKYTPLIQGYYQVNGSIQDISNTDVYDIIVYIYKNGASASQGRIRYIGATNDDLYTSVVSTSDIIYMDGVDDYLQLYAQIASEDASGVKVNDSQVATFMSAVLVSRTG